MRPVFYSEVEAFPKAVLAHHWPDVPDLGDMTTITGAEWKGKVDIFWGSTPCQAFSSAGNREGTNDPRGALTLAFVDIANTMNPDFIVWENVKGVFSDDHNAFGHFLAALAGEDEPLVPSGKKWTNAGYVLGPQRTVAWRVFNAQHSGVPQRRHRVFVVACPVGGADPREILFESDQPRRDTPPSHQAQTQHPGIAYASTEEPTLSPVCYVNTDAHTKVSLTTAYPLKADQGSGGRGSVALPVFIDGQWETRARRLTPEECERLQGMPEFHTKIPYAGKPAEECPDSLRWKTLGNSLNVLDARWIGERILASRGTPVTFWDDNPKSILLEDCYVPGCTTMTTGGGSKDGVSVSLCPSHRNREGVEIGIGELKRWNDSQPLR